MGQLRQVEAIAPGRFSKSTLMVMAIRSSRTFQEVPTEPALAAAWSWMETPFMAERSGAEATVVAVASFTSSTQTAAVIPF